MGGRHGGSYGRILQGFIFIPGLHNITYSKRCPKEQNQQLIKEFEASEIKEAIFSLHPDKSLGPDGMNPGFFQAYWDIIGGEVTTTCLRLLNNWELSGDWNNTHIVLISKKVSPEKNFRLKTNSTVQCVVQNCSKHLSKSIETYPSRCNF